MLESIIILILALLDRWNTSAYHKGKYNWLNEKYSLETSDEQEIEDITITEENYKQACLDYIKSPEPWQKKENWDLVCEKYRDKK